MDATTPAITVLESPMIAPDHEAPTVDAPKVDVAKPEPVKPDAIKVEPVTVEAIRPEPPKLSTLASTAPRIEQKIEPKIEPVVTDAPKLDMPRMPSRLVMMPSANESLRMEGAAPERGMASAKTFTADSTAKPTSDFSTGPGKPVSPEAPALATASKRSMPAAAAMLALALLGGVIGGALATTAFLHGSRSQPETAAADPALVDSVARIENDIATLKARLEQTSQTSLVELNKTSERLDKVEKAQNELAAKSARPAELQKLSETVERLRAAQASATQPPAREATGTVPPAAQAIASATPATAAAAAAKPADANKPKVVDGWVLRDVGRGGALIEGRDGLYEVYPGDPVPGLGKVDAIRRQDGRWVVVTTKGIVAAR
jgi:hypothetical protein